MNKNRRFLQNQNIPWKVWPQILCIVTTIFGYVNDPGFAKSAFHGIAFRMSERKMRRKNSCRKNWLFSSDFCVHNKQSSVPQIQKSRISQQMGTEFVLTIIYLRLKSIIVWERLAIITILFCLHNHSKPFILPVQVFSCVFLHFIIEFPSWFWIVSFFW